MSSLSPSMDDIQYPSCVRVTAGDYYVSTKNEVISTVLGSCVSVCLRDPVAQVGGINHFMLPTKNNDAEVDSARYGDCAMRLLLQKVQHLGGRPENFEFKIFGGSSIMQRLSKFDVGKDNVDFILVYMRQSGFTISAQDLGGVWPRKLMYFVETGVVKMKRFKLD